MDGYSVLNACYFNQINFKMLLIVIYDNNSNSSLYTPIIYVTPQKIYV